MLLHSLEDRIELLNAIKGFSKKISTPRFLIAGESSPCLGSIVKNNLKLFFGMTTDTWNMNLLIINVMAMEQRNSIMSVIEN